jgi:hypothetical protein
VSPKPAPDRPRRPGAARQAAEEAASAVQGALSESLGAEAAERLALAQAQLAWQEAIAEAGLDRGGLASQLLRVEGGTGHVTASEPILAQELRLRAEALAWAVNQRMAGRPGATLRIRRLAVSVGRRRPASASGGR